MLEEFKKNMRWGFFAIGILLVFMSGYYLKSLEFDMDRECSLKCETMNCMDYDSNCGYLGVFYFKNMIIFLMGFYGMIILLFPHIKHILKNKKC